MNKRSNPDDEFEADDLGLFSLATFLRTHGLYWNLNDELDDDPHGNSKSCLPKMFILKELSISQRPDSCSWSV